MSQLRYAWMDVRGNRRFYLVQFILVLVTFLLIGYCVSQYAMLDELSDTAGELMNMEETYIITDVTDFDTFSSQITKPENTAKLYELYQFINRTEHYRAAYAGSLSLEAFGETNLVQMDDNAMRLFGIETAEGGSVIEALYDRRSEYIPVFAGHDMRKSCEVGDVLLDEFVVVGVLKEGAFYLQPSFSPDVISLDSSLLYASVVTESSDFGDLDAAITQTCLVTGDKGVLNEISERSTQLGLYSLRFTSVSEQLNRIYEQELKGVRYSLLFISMSVALSIACMMSAMLAFVERHIKEFAIHIMCGATSRSLAARVMLQSGGMYIASFLIASLLFQSLTIALWLLVLSLVMCAAVTMLPVIRLKRSRINQLIRRSE